MLAIYIIIIVQGTEQTSDQKKKTLYPTYYQTFDFNVQLSENPEFRPLITLQLYDKDTLQSKFLGIAQYNLSDCLVTKDPKVRDTKDPVWIDFYHTEPGDSQGSVLVSATIIILDVIHLYYYYYYK